MYRETVYKLMAVGLVSGVLWFIYNTENVTTQKGYTAYNQALGNTNIRAWTNHSISLHSVTHCWGTQKEQ